MQPLTVKDIAWLAGLYEGEGWFGGAISKGVRYKKPYWYPCIRIVSTDQDIMKRVSILIDRPVNGPYMAKKSTKPYWQVTTVCSRAIGLAMMLYPLLGNRRQARVRELISKWKEN